MSQELPVAVILSDVHLGDASGVVSAGERAGYTKVGSMFVRVALVELVARIDALLKRATKDGGGAPKIPYLVLDGDFWDIAIRNLSDVARLSQAFFKAMQLEKRFDQILFLPGNHDHQLWTMTQTQTCVIRPLEYAAGFAKVGSGVVNDFPQVVSARLELDGSGGHELHIPGVTPPYRGHIFATGLTGGRLPVNVVYPNLYVCNTAEETAALVTHGHFLQTAWRLLSDLAEPALGRDIPAMSLYYLQLLNAPLTDFINYSVAQVGPLSSVVNRIYDEVRRGGFPPELRALLESLRALLDRELSYEDEPWLVEKVKEFGSDRLIGLLVGLLRRALESTIRASTSDTALPTARHELGFLAGDLNRARLDDYVQLSRRDLPNYRFETVAFGHTHESIPGEDCVLPRSGALRVWNAGSLVAESVACDFLPLVITGDGRIRAFS